LIDKVKTILSDERGTTYIESGLWIALVVLVIAVAGVKLANVMQVKFGEIQGIVEGVEVPDPTEFQSGLEA